MFNIVVFPPEKNDSPDHGYEKLYEYSKIKNKIVTAKNLGEAANYKNKKILIALEDYAFDEGAIKIIAEKKKSCFLIDLSKIINSYGTPRAIRMARLRIFLKLCVKYGAYYTFVDFAKDEFELRSARELMHICLLLGLNLGQAKFALKMLPHYLQ
ncbi:MAG TPA: hypothetical protein VJH24_00470 [Candidatus Bilamarchaeaceae archaeon]|nr:hypothetical protein [Candidatus Bilamarchaeaceae archaeon]